MRLSLGKARVMLLLILLSGYSLFAQPGGPGGDPDLVPISGVEVLLGAGVLLGAKRFIAHRKSKF